MGLINPPRTIEKLKSGDYLNDKIRKAWVVVINYEDNFGDNVTKRYTEGAYSYFVDATTGEIIGGHTMDYIYSESR